MSKRTRALASTLVLLAVAAGAVLFAWFGIARKDEASHATKLAEAKLYAFAPADVTSLTVEAKGDVTRAVRAGDRWRIEAPVTATGERAAIDAMLDRIATLSRTSAVAASAEALERYGLTRPRAKVTLALKDGKTETLTLGDENPFDGTAFVRTTGGAVALVPGDLRWAVERNTFDLREKRLLPFEENEVERIEVAAPTSSYAIAQGGTGTWRLDAPVKGPADDATTGRVLGAIRGLRATAFEPAAAGDRATSGAPRWRVTLVAKGGSRRTVDIFPGAVTAGRAATSAGRADPDGAASGAAPSPSLRARLEGSTEVALLPATATKDLDQDLFALRDKRVLRFDRERVGSIRFQRDGGQFEVRRETAPAKLAGYLWTLSSLRAKAFADESGKTIAEHGLAHPALTVALVATDGKEAGKLLVSAPQGGKTFAAAASSGAPIVEIDPAAIAELPRTAKDAEEASAAGPQAKARGAGPK